MKKTLIIVTFSMMLLLLSCGNKADESKAKTSSKAQEAEWVSWFNGKDLSGLDVHGKAVWTVENGVLVGKGGMGHIYGGPVLSDLEVKGTFRISDKGNSGLYFRANPPADNPDGFPRGYEAQIDNHSDAFTGWIWKPGTPSGKAKALITKDNEWFTIKVQAIGDDIKVWVNGEFMSELKDTEYKEGRFAIQGHNPGQTIEAKELYYRDLSKK
jgi:hypothetical protein